MPFGAGAVLAAWVAAWSLVSFVQFGLDKRSARSGGARIPEARLLGIALIGGAAGAKLAQRLFRHKTRKQPFGGLLDAALIVNLAVILGAVALGAR